MKVLLIDHNSQVLIFMFRLYLRRILLQRFRGVGKQCLPSQKLLLKLKSSLRSTFVNIWERKYELNKFNWRTMWNLLNIIKYDLISFGFLGTWTWSGRSYFESRRSWSCFSAKGGLSFCLVYFSANSCSLLCFNVIRTILTDEMKLVIFWAWLRPP